MSDYSLRREAMVRDQIAARGVKDARVLAAMRQVPRHEFVPEHLRAQAYGDHALPIGGGQTISQPYIVAKMTELLDVHPEHTVLEIGTGSGYQTAILAKLARRVFSLERVPELARTAIERMRRYSSDNVKIQIFDGSLGWRDMGPFDRILVTAGAPSLPRPLLEQLKEGGKVVIPEGTLSGQRLVLYEDTPEGVVRTVGEPVAFVPLVGKHGWEG